ncbi:iron complex outermembrane receptor protein [Neorhizobium huautlense]|uniref:Iron complex outermembrane receptor protein n=1 Tax=Neorhizobium huautlense TaxID=67774 RepID=A0ABT9PLZ8_9HYPH|nr:TonB-dependent receptor [Neorhizobium huautlense]MDP9835487.1 iron complex outermembrane receptor protein [Neorhizobium huautlense]
MLRKIGSRMVGIGLGWTLLTTTSLVAFAMAAQAQETARIRNFSIPTQNIAAALVRYSSITGINVVYDGSLPAGARSSAVSGRLSDQQALDQLLVDSGLTYRFGANDTVTIIAPGKTSGGVAADGTTMLGTITVEGESGRSYGAVDSSVGTRTDTPLRDVPQSIQVVKRSVITDQQATTLTQALQNVSNVQQSNTGANRAETFITRGFSSGTYAIDGSVLNATGSRPEVNPDLAGVERVEVLKGPASVLYGRGEPGGLINIVTRRPTTTPTAEATTQLGSFGFRRAEATASGPLNDDASLTGRITGAAQREEGFVENRPDSERQYIGGVLEWNPDEDTRVSLSIDHTRQKQPYDRGLVVGTNGEIIDVPYDSFFGEEWSMVNSRKTRVSLSAEHQTTDWLKLRGTVRYDDAYTTDTGIDFRELTDADGSMLRRRYTDRVEDMRNLDLQFEGVMTFDTGDIGHTVLAGVQHTRSHMDFWSARANIAPIDIYNPVYGAPMTPTTLENVYVQDILASSVYLQDQIEFSDQWKALVGLRYDHFDHTVEHSVGDEEPPFDGGALTWRAGLVYQPTDRLSFYTSYATSFMPQSALNQDGQVLDPEEGWQVEAGVKAELTDRLSATFSVFHITKNNVAVAVDEEDYSRLSGQQRSRGAEIDITGEIMDGWQVIASLGYVDAEVTKDDTPSYVGNRLIGTPYWSGSLWTTYEFHTRRLEGLKLGAGITAVGKRAGDLEKPFYVDGYYRVDAAVSYKINDNLNFSLVGRNLTDEKYIESTASRTENHPGAPINFMAALKASF